MAIGVTFAITSDGIDLSIGTVLTCSALISGQLITKYHLPVALGLLVCIFIGALFGLLNGLMVSYMHLPPFIATLGSMMLSKGLGSIFYQGAERYFGRSPARRKAGSAISSKSTRTAF